MSLSEQLRRMKESFAADTSVPAATKEVMASFARDLKDSRLELEALKPWNKAPDFALPAADGGTVSLARILATGPAALCFFRGRW